MDNLYYEAESIVMALWEESREEIVLEVMSRLNITEEYSFDLVTSIIVAEQQLEEKLSGEDNLFDWGEDSVESLSIVGVEENYGG